MTTSNDAKPHHAKPKKKLLSKGHGLAIVAFFIAFIALMSSGYSLYSAFHQRRIKSMQIEHILNQVASLRQQQLDTKAQIDNAMQSITESDNALKNKLDSLSKHLQDGLQQRSYKTKDWLLIKARHYLELAQMNANWGTDLQTTTALLEEADALLADIPDQRTFMIRQAIAKEIAEIKALPTLDTAGLLSQLDAAQLGITRIPLQDTLIESNRPSDSKETAASPLKESLNLLKGLVIIRHRDETIRPLPSKAYEGMLREEIRLNLQEAEWALLKNNEGIYQFALSAAIKNIMTSFAGEAPATKAIIIQLQHLQKTHLARKKPLLKQSLLLLNELIESKDTLMPSKDQGESSS